MAFQTPPIYLQRGSALWTLPRVDETRRKFLVNCYIIPLNCQKVKSLGCVSCDRIDCSLPGFSVHGIFQARILEWAAISFSRGSSQPGDRTWVSHIVGRCFYRLSHQGSPSKAHIKTTRVQDFPGGPVVKTPSCQHRGTSSIPGQGTKIPHAAWCGQKIKKKKLIRVLLEGSRNTSEKADSRMTIRLFR